MRLPRSWSAAALVILLTTVAGCGGGDTDEPAAKTAPQAATADDDWVIYRDLGDPPNADARTAIKEVLSDVQADFPLSLTTGVCSELSWAGEDELEAAGIDDSGDCDVVMGKLMARAQAAGLEPRYSRVMSVTVNREAAIAVVREKHGKPHRVPFVEEDGRGWKLVSLTFAEPIEELLHGGG